MPIEKKPISPSRPPHAPPKIGAVFGKITVDILL
jgi:hypothetical protein